jgi:putative tricarboxylic transport membrane protein
LGDLGKGYSSFDLELSKKAALLTATSLILLGLVVLIVDTFNMSPSILPGYPGDAFYPRLVLGFSVIFALVILARGVFLPQEAAAVGDEAPTFDVHWLELATVFILALVYVAILEPIGFELATTLLMLCLIGPRLLMPPARALVIGTVAGVGTMLFLYVCFVPLLGVFLPLRFLPRYLSF